MKTDVVQLQASLEQMDRLFAALEDLRQTVLPANPSLFALMAEGPLDELAKIRHEIAEQTQSLVTAS